MLTQSQMKIENRFPLDIVVERKGGKWILREPFCYITRKNGVIWIDRGFETDFASIPQLLWNIYPPWGDKWIKAAISHDGTYATELFRRPTCDWLFLEALQDNGANWIDRNVFYTAVRSCGWVVWHKHTRGPGGTIETARKYVSIITLDELIDRITLDQLLGMRKAAAL